MNKFKKLVEAKAGKYDSILGNTMSTIAGDLGQAMAEMGDNLTSDSLADGALDYVSIHGGDEALAKEFNTLSYKEQLKIAKKVAKYYI